MGGHYILSPLEFFSNLVVTVYDNVLSVYSGDI